MDNIRLITTLPATPEDVYDAWLSSHGHTAMTGGVPATSEPRVGTMHMAWAGYISGQHVELEPGRRILQTWRTTEFPETAPDSLLEVILTRDAKGTRVTLIQNGIPDGEGEKYHLGWQEHYFAPMREHFGKAMAKTPGAGSDEAPEAKPARARPAPEAKPARATATATARKKAKPARTATKAVKSAKAAPARPAKKAKRATGKKAAKRASAKAPKRAAASKKAARGTAVGARRSRRTAKKAAGRGNKK
jgi:uncharacterized protein YndB with AHSA1/START domain